MLLSYCSYASALNCNVRDFGAKGDGKSIDSPAIDLAIRKVSESGGGTVIIPSGIYLCYSIHLMSDVRIQLEKGSVVRAADGNSFDLAEPNPFSQYQDYGHSHFHNSLIWGEDISNIAICGEGFMDGTALLGGYDGKSIPDGKANKMIALHNCRDVLLEGFTAYRGGHFVLLATGVDNLVIKGLTIDTGRDGLDIDCCKKVSISDCTVNCPWDDAIVLKSSYALGYFRDTEDVSVSRCKVSSYLEGTLLDGTRVSPIGKISPFYGAPGTDMHGGRIKIGTESSGGFRNITVSNCILTDTGGLIINSMDGGLIENVSYKDIRMTRIFDCPIFLRLGNRMRSPEGTPVGGIRNISFENIIAEEAFGRWPMMIAGIPGHQIEDIHFKNIDINYEGGFSPEGAIDPIPEKTKSYPDPWLFRKYTKESNRIHNQYMPFRSLMIRHARHISFDGIRFSFQRPDSRTDYYIEDAFDVTGL